MKKNNFKIVLYLVILIPFFAFSKTYRVFFKDKGFKPFYYNSELYKETLNKFNKKCLDRRSKVLTADSIISFDDVELYNPYLLEMENEGAKILNKLKWKNYCIIEIDEDDIDNIEELQFVKKVEPTSSISTLNSANNISEVSSTSLIDMLSANYVSDYDLYGESYNQLNLLNIPYVHHLGFYGQNVFIGFCDNGFRWKSHDATKNTAILNEYDFIYRDSMTSNQEGDPGSQDGHGQMCFSVVSGLDSTRFIGVAPKANFALAKTEDMRYEKRIEEDNLAEAIEWLESLGVDVISSSLGYFAMDSTEQSYLYKNLDGNSSIAAQYCNMAVKRGVVYVSAAGNLGPSMQTISSPGDADSVITVGALRQDGIITADLSSRGPLLNGKMKPNVMANGMQVACVNPGTSDKYMKANGTSLATPLISGFSTLMLNVFPEMKPWELRDAMYKSSSNYTTPNDVAGYGKPDLLNALLNYGIVISPPISYSSNIYQRILNTVLAKNAIIKAELYIRFASNTTFEKFNYNSIDDDMFAADIPLKSFRNLPAECYIVAYTLESSRRYPIKDGEYFKVNPDENNFPIGIDIEKLPIKLTKETSSFVYPIVANKGVSEISLQIIQSIEGNIGLSIYDCLGVKVDEYTLGYKNSGIIQKNINVDKFSSGMYFIEINKGYEKELVKFIINR